LKAVIKIVTAESEFTEDQKRIMKRVSMVLIEHNLSVALIVKEKRYKTVPFKLKKV
jgi:hypothetical protein